MGEEAGRLDAIEERLRKLEDVADINRLLATYGPAHDSDNPGIVSGLWTHDGTYDVNGRVLRGEGIQELTRGDRHRDNMQHGCAHIPSLSAISVDGDTATATGYQVLIVNGPEGPRIHASASSWQLTRTSEGWQAADRKVRILDGNPDAQRLLEWTFNPGA